MNSFGVHAVDGILDALATGFLATPVANANLVTSLKALSQKTEKSHAKLGVKGATLAVIKISGGSSPEKSFSPDCIGLKILGQVGSICHSSNV